EILQFRHRNPDQFLHRFGDMPDFGFGERLRRPAAGGIELVIDQAAPPGIRDTRTVIDVGHPIGDGQNAGDMVRSRKAGHADVSTPALLCKVWHRRRGSQSPSRTPASTGSNGAMRNRSRKRYRVVRPGTSPWE